LKMMQLRLMATSMPSPSKVAGTKGRVPEAWLLTREELLAVSDPTQVRFLLIVTNRTISKERKEGQRRKPDFKQELCFQRNGRSERDKCRRSWVLKGLQFSILEGKETPTPLILSSSLRKFTRSREALSSYLKMRSTGSNTWYGPKCPSNPMFL
jgi:hypothetical protein